jgi:hypothetical protein
VNDAFAGAVALPATATGSVAGENTWGTSEPNEPATCVDCGGLFNGPNKTIWYSWTAPSNGTATVGTCGASSYDTMLAIYTGTAIGSLTRVANNDDGPDACGLGLSQVTFPATAGTKYWFQVDGWQGRTGTYTLSWSLS